MTDKIRIKKFILNNRNQFAKWGDAAAEKNLHNSMEANDLLVRFCDAVVSFIDSMQEEPVSEDLEEELKAYVNSKEYINNIGTSGLLLIARHFAQWQKEQMMKDAVECDIEGTIIGTDGNCGLARIKGDYNYGDKVKLITVNED